MTSRIKMYSLVIIYLLIDNSCFANNINESNIKVKYYRWAMIERQDRKPIFSATTTLKHIYDPNNKHEKNYYKVIYKDGVVNEVSTYEKDKLIRVDFFDNNEIWLNYWQYKKDKKINCEVNMYTLEKRKSILTLNCNDNSKKTITYLYKELNKEQKRILGEDTNKTSSYWRMSEVVNYQKGQKVLKQIIKDSTCLTYDENNTLIEKTHCSDYEHTKPMDNAIWSLVPMW